MKFLESNSSSSMSVMDNIGHGVIALIIMTIMLSGLSHMLYSQPHDKKNNISKVDHYDSVSEPHSVFLTKNNAIDVK